MEFVTFKVEGMCSEKDSLNVINALHKYSGVNDIAVDVKSGRVRVEFDPRNILRQDIQRDIERENYRVSIEKP